MLNTYPSRTTGRKKWILKSLQIDNRDWKKYIISNYNHKNCKLKWFIQNYQQNPGTNSFFFKIKMINSKIGSFCHRDDKTIEHILWECNHVQSFLEDVEYYVEEKTNLP